MGAKVSFRAMKDGTAADYSLLRQEKLPTGSDAAEIALGLLRQLDDDPGPFLVNRYTHSLQTATRALRDRADEELVVAGLLHDIGDVISPFNHPAVSAEVLQPFVSETTYEVVRHHGLFQSYYYAHHLGGNRLARDDYRGQPWFKECVTFCERWDQASFDPDYDTQPLETFLPFVHSVFNRTPAVLDRSPIMNLEGRPGKAS